MDYRNEFRSYERDAYWSFPRVFALLLSLGILAYGIGFFVTGGDLFIYKVFAPRYENAKRQVFENTQGYVQGKVEYLSTLRLDYEGVKAQPGGDIRKESIRRLILTEASMVDNSRLPADLQSFISDLKVGAQ